MTEYDVGLDRPREPLGLVPRAAADGTVFWEYEVRPEHFNPHGALHGGVLATLLDTAMGHVVAREVMPQGRINAAANLDIQYLAPVRRGVEFLRATARITKLGKRLAFTTATAVDDKGTVVATATSTQALLP